MKGVEPVKDTSDRIARPRWHPRLALQGAGLLVVLGLTACDTPHSGMAFWDIGAEYRLTLLDSDENNLLVDESGHLDSLLVALRISTMAGDSIRGVYDGAFARFGLRVGRATPGPQLFAGVAHDDSLLLRLTPDATDAGMLLEGRSVGSTIRGTWRTEVGSKRGSFILARAD